MHICKQFQHGFEDKMLYLTTAGQGGIWDSIRRDSAAAQNDPVQIARRRQIMGLLHDKLYFQKRGMK